MDEQKLIKLIKEEGTYEAFEEAGYQCVIMRANYRMEKIRDWEKGQLKENDYFTFHWCGYVGTPKTHPLYGKSYSDKMAITEELRNKKYDESRTPVISLLCASINEHDVSLDLFFEVHGGTTYADNSLFMQPQKDLWWFGFDCSHAGDLSSHSLSYPPIGNPVYRTKEYVMQECKNLAQQLKKWESHDRPGV